MSSEEPHAHAHAQCQHHEAHHHHEHAHGHEGHGHGHEHAHGHHGHHGHGHEHGTAAEANKDYFDEHAHEQAESAELRGLAEQAARAMAQQARLDKESTALLDFACGTGLLSRALAPLVKSVVGVDISPRSVELYNKAAAEAGYAPERMRAVALELKGEPGELGGALFDAAVCSMSFHHFDAPEHMAALLAARLKPGAPLLVVDFAEREDGAPAVVLNDVNPTLAAAVPHIRGFSEARLRSMFAAAGLTDFALADAGPFSWRGASAKLFVARGVKP